MKRRYDYSLEYFIGYSEHGNIHQNLFIITDKYFNIITDYFNRPIKGIKGFVAGAIATSILNKDKVIKDEYKKTLPI